MEVPLASALVDALPGAAVGAVLAVLVAEAVRSLLKPRAEFVDRDHETKFKQSETFYGIEDVGESGTAQIHQLKFKVHGQPPGLAAARLAWGKERTFAKWNELPEPLDEPVEKNGRTFRPFVSNLVPSTFFLQLSDNEEYKLPVLVEYDDLDGNRVCDVFSAWWYGKGKIRSPKSFRVTADDEVEVTLLGLVWQNGSWRFWTRRRSQRFKVSQLRGN